MTRHLEPSDLGKRLLVKVRCQGDLTDAVVEEISPSGQWYRLPRLLREWVQPDSVEVLEELDPPVRQKPSASEIYPHPSTIDDGSPTHYLLDEFDSTNVVRVLRHRADVIGETFPIDDRAVKRAMFFRKTLLLWQTSSRSTDGCDASDFLRELRAFCTKHTPKPE